MKHMKEIGLFSDRQFCFLNGHSTVLQLMVVLDKCMRIIEEGRSIDYIYCDFKKAFDKIHTKGFLRK